jgi:hypothetical protein
MPPSKLLYGIFGLALLLFIVGFLSIFQTPTSTAGKVRVWEETEAFVIRQPVTMKPGNRWDAEFIQGKKERPKRDLSEIFELVGVVGSNHSHALIRIKEPKDKSALVIKRVEEGGGLVEGVKVIRIEAARVTIQSKDGQVVLTLYSLPTQENEKVLEKKS